MTADNQYQETRQERREKRLWKKRWRMPQHGKNIAQIYRNIVVKKFKK